MAGFSTPVAVFHQLFSAESTPLAQRQTLLKQQRSVLDTVLDDAAGVARGLGKDDADKLAEYLQSIRDIETRLAKEEQWLGVPKAQPAESLTVPQGAMKGYDEIKLMYDLLVAALQTDTTRVATYRQPVDTLIQGLSIPFSGHNLSHYGPGPRMEASQLRDRKQSELLAHRFDKLKATREPNASWRAVPHMASPRTKCLRTGFGTGRYIDTTRNATTKVFRR